MSDIQDKKQGFRNWLKEREYTEGTANLYAFRVKACSALACEQLGRNIDFYSMTDADELEKKVQELHASLSPQDRARHNGILSVLGRYVEFVKITKGQSAID